MAYVSPSSITTGCLISANHWNQDVVSNIEYFKNSPCIDGSPQVAGSVLVGTARTVILTNGAVTIDGANGGWATGYMFSGSGNAASFGGFGAVGTGSSLSYYWVGSAFDATALRINTGCLVLINDTSNACMTTGLTINQGANSGEALALKSSAVSHGVTDGSNANAETDTYATLQLHSGISGGVRFNGWTEAITAIELRGTHTNETNIRSTAADAPIELAAYTKSSACAVNPSANVNLVTIRSGANTQFVFDSDGDLSANAALSASAYDAYDDAQLGRALQAAVRPAATIQREALRYGRDDLERAGVAVFNDGPGGDGSVFVNYTKLAWVSIGAHWQAYERQQQLERRIEQLTRAVMVLGGSALLLSEGGNT